MTYKHAMDGIFLLVDQSDSIQGTKTISLKSNSVISAIAHHTHVLPQYGILVYMLIVKTHSVALCGSYIVQCEIVCPVFPNMSSTPFYDISSRAIE